MLFAVLSHLLAIGMIYYLGYSAGNRAGRKNGKLLDLPIGRSLGLKDGNRKGRRF
jgi:hypothetical protein